MDQNHHGEILAHILGLLEGCKFFTFIKYADRSCCRENRPLTLASSLILPVQLRRLILQIAHYLDTPLA